MARDVAWEQEFVKSLVGRSTGKARVVVERGPVSTFAAAVYSTSPIYRNPEAARAAGFEAIPAPPTWSYVMQFTGTFEEIQPEDPEGGESAVAAVGPLRTEDSLLLHGEQEFIYHRPIQVGDVLVGEGSITESYQKESRGKTMTFVVSETHWRDDSSGEPVATVRSNLIHRS